MAYPPEILPAGVLHSHWTIISASVLPQALVFVRDLDSGPLGFCAEQGDLPATQHDTFRVLHMASHELVNDVLKVRQLLKRKATDATMDIPRPTILTRSESVSH